MNIAKIDNSVFNEIGNVILWQYDKAWNLISTIRLFQLFFDISTKSFWDRWIIDVFCQFEKDDSGEYKYDATEFGLSVWGIILGVPRAIINNGGTETPISIDLYRRLLEGKFRIMNSNHSSKAICEYLNTVYQGRVSVTDNLDMTITFNDIGMTEEEILFAEQHEDIAYVFPAAVRTRDNYPLGVVFAFNGQESEDTRYPRTNTFDNANFISPSYKGE